MLHHIPLTMHPSAVHLVEQGHQYEGVEDHGEQLRGLGVRLDIIEVLNLAPSIQGFAGQAD